MGKRREVVRELQMDLARVIQLQAQAAHVNGEADGWLASLVPAETPTGIT